MSRLALATLVLAGGLGFAHDGTPTGEPAIPAVSMFVGGNNGPGWWAVYIDEVGSLKIGSSDARRRLTKAQRATLLGLLSKLPPDRRVHDFSGTSYVDLAVLFELKVGRGASTRTFLLNSTFADYRSHPELKDILAVMHFLRTFVSDKDAHTPPTFPDAGAEAARGQARP